MISKITVNMSPLILRRVKAIVDDEHQWHRLDDSRRRHAQEPMAESHTTGVCIGLDTAPPRIPIVSIELSCSKALHLWKLKSGIEFRPSKCHRFGLLTGNILKVKN